MGGFAHADLRFGRFHADAALRLDKFSSVTGVIFSPRLAVLFKPTPSQTVRASFGRSFLAPTALDDYFDLRVRGLLFPVAGQLVPIVMHVHGDPDVKEESLTMWEIGYTGVFGRTTAGVAVYVGDLHDPIANVALRFYTSADPPEGWPLPFLLDVLAQRGVVFPSEIATTNLGPVRNRGFEVSVSHRFAGGVTSHANYSWQDDPEPRTAEPGTPPYPAGALNVPPHQRVNLGVSLDRGRFLGGVTLGYTSAAFWADVLGPPFWGATPDHTLLGASAGVRLADNRLTLMLKATNLLDEDVQYHVFGDIANRSVVLQATVCLCRVANP